jgi:hypothetical protein
VKYTEWTLWLRSLPRSLVWFPILILIRPIIDNLYFLKNISPFLSPLYIVGALTPLLCYFSIIKSGSRLRTIPDKVFRYWSILLFLSSLMLIFIYSFRIESIALFLKIILPLFLFPFLRVFINSRRDLNGILQTFLYSCIISIVLFILAKYTGTMNISFSRGVERESGYYSDVANLSFYITMGFLISAYFNLLSRFTKRARPNYLSFFLIICVCIAGLITINHVTTIGVFLTILLIYLLFALRKNLTYSFLIIIFLTGFYYFFGHKLLEESVNPLIGNEIEILKGERDQSQLLHGRMSRWPMMTGLFFSLNPMAVLFGASLSFNTEISILFSGVVHNDFLRILFSSGIIGLLLYLVFIFGLYSRLRKLYYPDKFLGFAAIATLVLYSITMLPNMYPNLCYVLYSVYAFLLLPISVKYDPIR